MAQKILQQSREAETALAAALVKHKKNSQIFFETNFFLLFVAN